MDYKSSTIMLRKSYQPKQGTREQEYDRLKTKKENQHTQELYKQNTESMDRPQQGPQEKDGEHGGNTYFQIPLVQGA